MNTNNKKIILYGHGGAYNHGAEAIVQSTVSYIKTIYNCAEIILSTHFKEQDIEFNLPIDEYCERDENGGYTSLIDKIDNNSLCFSIGGDNYCYNNWKKWNDIVTKAKESGAKNILWSCSVEPSMIDDEMLQTLKKFDLITARENITYSYLKKMGITNVLECSDIAFSLDKKKSDIKRYRNLDNCVAINISPLIIRREKINNIIMDNIIVLINFILNNTDMNIILIPHVTMPADNDLLVLNEISKMFSDERVVLISEKYSASEYKYIISKCRMGVFSRTHASIAAYSTCIPCIALGYSVKAKGIAQDLGMEDYVLPIDKINDKGCIYELFVKLLMNEEAIRNNLKSRIPKYINKCKPDISKI